MKQLVKIPLDVMEIKNWKQDINYLTRVEGEQGEPSKTNDFWRKTKGEFFDPC